jgi:hypothetical protein
MAKRGPVMTWLMRALTKRQPRRRFLPHLKFWVPWVRVSGHTIMDQRLGGITAERDICRLFFKG